MTRGMKRVLLTLAVAVMGAGAGSALFASPAAATGGVDDRGGLWGQINNLTPYTWTLDIHGSRDCDRGFTPAWSCGFTNEGGGFPQQVKPGQSFVYVLRPYSSDGCIFDGVRYYYDGFFVYKAQAVDRTEYLTFAVSQYYEKGTCGNSHMVPQVYNTVALPNADYDPSRDIQSGPRVARTANPQIGWTHSDDFNSDVTFEVAGGDYTVDASKDPPQLVDMLNALCSNAVGTTCAFTASGPMEWGIGTAQKQAEALNCTGSEDPGEAEPNWFEVEYEAAQSATLTVGGGLTLSTEFNLFGSIGGEASIGAEAEHDWGQTKTFTRATRVYVPPNSIADLWVAPTEGKVMGTLVATTGNARYTVTNFGQTQSGVTRDDTTPAFDVIARTRPMTGDEIRENCSAGGTATSSASTRATRGRAAVARQAAVAPRPVSAVAASAAPSHGVEAAARRTAVASKPVAATAARIVPGRGIAGVKLGQTEAQVAKRLGDPLFKSSKAVECAMLDPRCSAHAARRGTWVYRRVSVAFGADGRVKTLVYKGRQTTGKGLGVGSRFRKVRAAHRRVRCVRYVAHTNCTLKGRYRRRVVKTVFHFTHAGLAGRKADRVMIHYSAGSRRGVRK